MLVSASGYSSVPAILASGFGTLGNFSLSTSPADTLGVKMAPPSWFQQPSSVLNRQMARAVSPEFAYEQPNAPRQLGSMDAAGAASANSTAKRAMVVAGMPVIFSAHSGVQSASDAAQSSKPTALSATYCLSYRPRVTNTFDMASRKAKSVPGLMGTHSSANAMELLQRGSTSTICAPFSWARCSSATELGRMASA